MSWKNPFVTKSQVSYYTNFFDFYLFSARPRDWNESARRAAQCVKQNQPTGGTHSDTAAGSGTVPNNSCPNSDRFIYTSASFKIAL